MFGTDMDFSLQIDLMICRVKKEAGTFDNDIESFG